MSTPGTRPTGEPLWSQAHMRGAGALEAFPALSVLELSVPIAILEMRATPASIRALIVEEAADALTECGDVLMFGERSRKGKPTGAAARVFAQLSRALACLALCPGGVTFAGMHFEGTPVPDMTTADAQAMASPQVSDVPVAEGYF